MSDDLVVKARYAVLNGKASFCKFLSANDSGETGGHQSGILISSKVREMFFDDQDLCREKVPKKYGKIKWQDDYISSCTFTWYESKHELRITGFGRGASPLSPDFTGALFVLIQDSAEDYQGFILNTDDDIQDFLDSFGLTPAETNRKIELKKVSTATNEMDEINSYIKALDVEFPSSYYMSAAARTIQEKVFGNMHKAVTDPDSILLSWTEEEYTLFRAIEQNRYGIIVSRGFVSVEDFVDMANKVLNRRKSRAGKSLEHHLSAIFDHNKIQYTAQAVTEGNKKPDFLFPSEKAYHDMTFSIEKLCTLAAKTTCKDRWRQILNEANRLRDRHKYLCTMQQGISSSQMDEMQEEKVILVVPKPYIKSFPRDKQDRIWTVSRFVNYVKEMEGII